MLLAVVVVGAVAVARLVRTPQRRGASACATAATIAADRPRSGRRRCSGGSTCASSCSTATSGRRRSCSSTSIGRRRGSIAHVFTQGRWWSRPVPPDDVDGPAVVGRGRGSPTSVAVVAVVGLIVAVVRPRRGTSRRAIALCLARRRSHHADGRPAPRRRRQSVPALLLPGARRAGRPGRSSASTDWCRACCPLVVVAAMAWWAIEADADRRRSGVHPAAARQRRGAATGAAGASRRRRLADGGRRADRRRGAGRHGRPCASAGAVEAANGAVESGIRWPPSCAHDRSSYSG